MKCPDLLFCCTWAGILLLWDKTKWTIYFPGNLFMQEEVGTHGFKKFNYYSDSLQSCAVPVTLVQDCCVTKNPSWFKKPAAAYDGH